MCVHLDIPMFTGIGNVGNMKLIGWLWMESICLLLSMGKIQILFPLLIVKNISIIKFIRNLVFPMKELWIISLVLISNLGIVWAISRDGVVLSLGIEKERGFKGVALAMQPGQWPQVVVPVLPWPRGSMLRAQVSWVTLSVCSGMGTLNLESRGLVFILGLYMTLRLSFSSLLWDSNKTNSNS